MATLLAFPVCRAELITHLALPSPHVTLNFDSFAGDGYGFTHGPVSLGDGVVAEIDNPGSGAVLGEGSYNFAGNGDWTNGVTAGGAYMGVDDGVASITFHFNQPVAEVGGIINYMPFDINYPGRLGHAVISAYDSDGVELESWFLETSAPILTPGGFNAGAFRGIFRAQSDISSFRVADGFIAIDDLTFTGSQAVPEPSTLGIIGAAFLGLVAAARRRTASRRDGAKAPASPRSA